ncbi:hypothetical protein RABR111495_18820 [Rahnella bruchi]
MAVPGIPPGTDFLAGKSERKELKSTPEKRRYACSNSLMLFLNVSGLRVKSCSSICLTMMFSILR